MYAADFELDIKVQCMNLEERGLYTKALNWSWIFDGLPNDPDRMHMLLRCFPDEFDRAWPAVKNFFQIAEDGRLGNPRQEEEREKALEKIDKHSRSGTAAQSPTPGNIYLVRRDSDGAVKIGSTRTVAKRMSQLRFKYRHESLTLLGSKE